MPAEEIAAAADFVLSLSGRAEDEAAAAAGAEIYADNCAACHGEAGEGDPSQGAPRLNDQIWLYGGDTAAITETVNNARFGVMPAWSDEFRPAGGLTRAEINAVAAYVHQLGGGQ